MMLSNGAFSVCHSISVNKIEENHFPSTLRSHSTRFTSPASLFAFCTINNNNSFLSSYPLPTESHFSYRPLCAEIRNGFCVSAVNKRSKGSSEVIEMDEVDDDGDDDGDGDGEWDDDIDGFGDENGDEDDEGLLLPFENMKTWLENKPSGFGEGKVYDTSVEDKLFEELEQSRRAQAANLNKLKNNPVTPGSKKDDKNKKALEDTLSGVRVRLSNLPKKMNIHRDLNSAFKGAPGLINISAAVSGNKKTKDPVCKGFGFVDFKSEKDATRFIETFSRENISFGRIQKHIKYEILSSLPQNPTEEISSDTNKRMGIISEVQINADGRADSSLSESPSKVASDEHDNMDNKVAREKNKIVKENRKSASKTEIKSGDKRKPIEEFRSNSDISKRLENIRALERRLLGRGKTEKPLERNMGKSVPPKFNDEKALGESLLDTSKRLENIRSLERKLLAKGKAEKAIKRIIVKSVPHKSNDEKAYDIALSTQSLSGPGSDKDIGSYSSAGDSYSKALMESDVDEHDIFDDEFDSVDVEDSTVENLECFNVEELKSTNNMKPVTDLTTESSSSKRVDKVQVAKKKIPAQVKVKKVPKLHVPGSAKRLKIKEKAILTGVLSKYAAKAALASTHEN